MAKDAGLSSSGNKMELMKRLATANVSVTETEEAELDTPVVRKRGRPRKIEGTNKN